MFETLQLHEVSVDNLSPDNENNLSSQMYLDLMNQLKEKYGQVEEIEKRVKKEHKQIISSITILYGLIKTIENVMNETLEIPHEIITLFECLETQIDEMLNIHIFSKIF